LGLYSLLLLLLFDWAPVPAGVGTPDLTYGVECQPAAGSVDNLHTNEPWLGETRLPLQPVNAGNRTCFDYTMKPNDTFASVAGED
jgi:hypothetical protein